jgi:hypothetical protein
MLSEGVASSDQPVNRQSKSRGFHPNQQGPSFVTTTDVRAIANPCETVREQKRKNAASLPENTRAGRTPPVYETVQEPKNAANPSENTREDRIPSVLARSGLCWHLRFRALTTVQLASPYSG